MQNQLRRSRDYRWFTGVCGGLGEYFDVDPTLVRVLFAAASVLGSGAAGLGWAAPVILYVVLSVVIPIDTSG